jgi:murein L,D-transpeptidase YafK
VRAALLLTILASGGAGRRLPPGSIDRIVIDKGDHELVAFDGGRVVLRTSVAIGVGGAGPKRVEGDGRTPEGVYRVDSRHPSRPFHRFLHVSYPNAEDRAAFRRGLRDGTVPRGARIGGDIGIHGAPRGPLGALHEAVDWTAGCIAVDDEEIEVLYAAVRPNAVVEIRP